VTLLEALVALVILGVSATAFLGLFQRASHSARDAAEWTRTVAYAESGMEAIALGTAPVDTLAGFARSVALRPWRTGLREVAVTVTSPRGVQFTLRRVVDEDPARALDAQGITR
jgi:Tfp pilus assembly protein PilV